MHKHTLIPGVHWPILRGLREADARALRADRVGRRTRSLPAGAFRPGLSWMVCGVFFFLAFLGMDGRWASRSGVAKSTKRRVSNEGGNLSPPRTPH